MQTDQGCGVMKGVIRMVYSRARTAALKLVSGAWPFQGHGQINAKLSRKYGTSSFLCDVHVLDHSWDGV